MIQEIPTVPGGSVRSLPVATAAYIGIQLIDRYEAREAGAKLRFESLPNHIAVGIDNDAERATLYLFDW